MSESWPEDALLAQAVRWVLEHRQDGVTCPCCGQFAKVYRRKLSSTMAYALILIDRHFRKVPGGWLHVPSYLTKNVPDKCGATYRGGDWAKMAYWGLIEEKDEPREDGCKHAGWWSITDLGQQFVRNQVRIPSHVLLYDQRLLSLDRTTMIGIKDALGDRFNYDELMDRLYPRPVPPPSGTNQLSLLAED